MTGFSPEEAYVERLSRALRQINEDAILSFVAMLEECRRFSRLVLTAGNGGSASTASHMATDLGVGSYASAGSLRIASLVDNAAIMTATANDVGYEETFVRQLRNLASPGDILVGFSASGNSVNLVRAFEYANDNGIKTVALTAFKGGRLKELAKLSIHVPTAVGDYGPAEDVHLAINHMVTEMMRGLAR